MTRVTLSECPILARGMVVIFTLRLHGTPFRNQTKLITKEYATHETCTRFTKLAVENVDFKLGRLVAPRNRLDYTYEKVGSLIFV